MTVKEEWTDAEYEAMVEELTFDPRVVNMVLSLPVTPSISTYFRSGPGGGFVDTQFAVTANIMFDRETGCGEEAEPRPIGAVPEAVMRVCREIGIIPAGRV